MSTPRDLATRLRELHSGPMLVLPNVWDAASAATVVEAGFPVVATASNAVAAMLGYADDDSAPWEEMFAAAGRVARVARAVDVPVTVDAEAGYGMAPEELVERLLALGAVGCNLEDSDHRSGGLVDADRHADRLAGVREAAERSGVPILLNARIDTFLPSGGIAEAERVVEAVRRGTLYRAAGADCLYPIGVSRRADLAALLAQLPGPVNGNVGEELDLATLAELGVARVSYGPTFYRNALAGFKADLEGLRP